MSGFTLSQVLHNLFEEYDDREEEIFQIQTQMDDENSASTNQAAESSAQSTSHAEASSGEDSFEPYIVCKECPKSAQVEANEINQDKSPSTCLKDECTHVLHTEWRQRRHVLDRISYFQNLSPPIERLSQKSSELLEDVETQFYKIMTTPQDFEDYICKFVGSF